MRRIALRLQYDGAAFAGSQWQPHLPTVQGALEDAIRNLTGEPAGGDPDDPCHAVSLAGRTDAGVHAQGQIASFLTDRDLSPRRFVRGLNHFLPPAAAVQDAWEAPLSFDPRRMAVEREYRYRLRIAEQRQPLHADHAWIVPPPFCPAAASAALHRLRGRRNFAAFAPSQASADGRAGNRHLRAAAILPSCDLDPGTGHSADITFRFVADAFLQHQVRRMVGAVVDIARARLAPTRLEDWLQFPVPGAAGPTAPPQGLTLHRVEYDRTQSAQPPDSPKA